MEAMASQTLSLLLTSCSRDERLAHAAQRLSFASADICSFHHVSLVKVFMCEHLSRPEIPIRWQAS